MTVRTSPTTEAARALAAWRSATGLGQRLPGGLPRRELHHLQRSRCYLCDTGFGPSERGRGPMGLTRDHVFPKTCGGTGSGNILLAHKLCNERKANRWPRPCEVLFLASVYAP